MFIRMVPPFLAAVLLDDAWAKPDRKSTRLNSSHDQISYAVFCLKKKKTTNWNETKRHNRTTTYTHISGNDNRRHLNALQHTTTTSIHRPNLPQSKQRCSRRSAYS